MDSVGGHLCCALDRALALDPVPVIGDMVYVPGAEGLCLTDVAEGSVNPCLSHRFTFKRTVQIMMDCAHDGVLCPCSSIHRSKDSKTTHVSRYVHMDCGSGNNGGDDKDTTPPYPQTNIVGLRNGQRCNRIQMVDTESNSSVSHVLRSCNSIPTEMVTLAPPWSVHISNSTHTLRMHPRATIEGGRSIQLPQSLTFIARVYPAQSL